MIQITIPQRSRSIPVSAIFTGNFNTPTAGQYDFNTTINQNVKLIPTIANTVYLIERYSVSANIANTDFITSIVTAPKLTLKRDNGKDTLMVNPIPINNLHEMEELNLWVLSNKANDYVTASIIGAFNQNINTVGVDPLRIVISFQIWAIDEKDFTSIYQKETTPVRKIY